MRHPSEKEYQNDKEINSPVHGRDIVIPAPRPIDGLRRCPCCDDFTLRETALVLFRAERLVKPVRLVGFGVSGFTGRPAQQLGLFDTQRVEGKEKLSRAVDSLREKYGDEAVGRGPRPKP